MVRVWTVSEIKAGTLTQCLGVGRFFDPEPKQIVVKRKLAFWQKGPLSPYGGYGDNTPDLIISCGSMAPAHVFAIVRACKRKPFTVHLQTPQDEFAESYDQAFIARHDWRKLNPPLPHYHSMIGAPHQIKREELEALRPEAKQRWSPDGAKTAAVLVGGPNEGYRYDPDVVDRLIGSIHALAEQGWVMLVSTSRRSKPEMLERLLAAPHPNVKVWDRQGHNPYREFLAAADALIVTKDTVTMACEAVTTGRPVYIFDLTHVPSAKLDKFEWFHHDMSETLRLTRPFEGSLDLYSYEPPAEAERIAGIVREAMDARKAAR